MSQPLIGIGAAVGDLVESERRKRDLHGAAEGAAALFDGLNTDNARQYAQMLRSDPRAAFTLAQEVGGMKQLIALEQANAARSKFATATASAAPGSAEQLRAIGTANFEAGELGSGTNAYVAASSLGGGAQKPIVREFKVGDTIETRQFDPATQTWTKLEESPRFAPRSGEEITVGPDGVTIRRGGLPGTTSTQTNIEKQISDARGIQTRLAAVAEQYQPKFLEVPFRAAQTLASWGEKLGREPTADERASLEEFSAFRGLSVDLVSNYLHALSGAAITPQEYKRLTESLPNAGYGLFDGDGPTIFESKLKATKTQGKLSLLRLEHERKHGLGLGESGFSLFDRKGILAQTGRDLEQELIAGGMPEAQARETARQRVAAFSADLDR